MPPKLNLDKDLFTERGPRTKADFVGRKFGRLTAIRIVSHNRHGHAIIECQCECGIMKRVSLQHILDGRVKSCGCLQLEKRGDKLGLQAHRQFSRILGRLKAPHINSTRAGISPPTQPASATSKSRSRLSGTKPTLDVLDGLDDGLDDAPTAPPAVQKQNK
jgi:hypothetical protein